MDVSSGGTEDEENREPPSAGLRGPRELSTSVGISIATARNLSAQAYH